MTKKANRQERPSVAFVDNAGSVFFYILLAVVLFATLAYMVTRSMRGSSTTAMSERQAEVAASDVLGIAQTLGRGVEKLQRKSCSENDISFANNIVSGYAHTPAAPDTCKIYHPDGAKLSYKAPLSDWLDSSQSAQTNYGEWYITGSSGVHSSSGSGDDLILILPYVKKSLCLAINDLMSIANTSDNPPADVGNGYALASKFTGSISGTDIIQAADNSFLNKKAGCFEGGGTPAASSYHFYFVLISR